MPPVAVQVSYRLGGADGVAVEARKWEWALHELGFRVRRVAGELDDGLRPDDIWLPFLAIDPPDGQHARSRRAGRDARRRRPRRRREPLLAPDQPRRVDAGRRRARRAQRAGRVPPPRPSVATRRARRTSRRAAAPTELAARHHQRPLARAAREPRLRRGHRSQRVRSRSRHAATASATRAEFGFAPDDVVLLQPTRAIPRKNIPAAVEFAAELAAIGTRIVTPALDHRARPKTATTTCSRACSPTPTVPGHRRSRRYRRRRLRGRRPRPVPVDVGGVRQPGHRVDRPPAPDRGRQLPGARRAPRRSACSCSPSTTSTASRRGSAIAATRGARDATWSGCDPTARSPDLPDAIDAVFAAAGWSAW